jgi:hypothetical protein
MKGTPSHRSLRILSTAMQNVGVRESCHTPARAFESNHEHHHETVLHDSNRRPRRAIALNITVRYSSGGIGWIERSGRLPPV